MPFPFADQPRVRLRPALVVATPRSPVNVTLTWTLMITSRLEPAWPGDVLIGERHAECGLSVPSLIRTAKIAAIDHTRAEILGHLPNDLWDEVRRQVALILA